MCSCLPRFVPIFNVPSSELTAADPVDHPATATTTATITATKQLTKGVAMSDHQQLTKRQLQILECIEQAMRDRGYPPSVREIGEAVGLSSSSTVHMHLETLQKLGYLRRDPTKPRAIEVRYDPATGSQAERRPVRHVPLIGHVAAGTGVLTDERVEEILPLPEDFTGDGNLFMLKVRGDSMINVGILDGDYVVVRQESDVRNGDTIVAGIPGEEATVKVYRKDGSHVVLIPQNPTMKEMRFPASEVTIFGRVVTVLRRM
jgi:repressor LexA